MLINSSSDTTALPVSGQVNVVDMLWEKMKAAYPTAESVEIHFPVDETSSILAAINPDASTYWKIDYIYFGQYTLKEVPADQIWDRFESATTADKLMRMNYDIHTGAIAGLPQHNPAAISAGLSTTQKAGGTYLIFIYKMKSEKKARQAPTSDTALSVNTTARNERPKVNLKKKNDKRHGKS